LEELADLKARHGMSIAAIMRRAKDLELITQRFTNGFALSPARRLA